MPKYRKKPVVIEAVQWIISNAEEVREFSKNNDCEVVVKEDMGVVTIDTMEGVMTAFIGDWIIKGVQGELYPCRPDIFEMTYDEVK